MRRQTRPCGARSRIEGLGSWSADETVSTSPTESTSKPKIRRSSPAPAGPGGLPWAAGPATGAGSRWSARRRDSGPARRQRRAPAEPAAACAAPTISRMWVMGTPNNVSPGAPSRPPPGRRRFFLAMQCNRCCAHATVSAIWLHSSDAFRRPAGAHAAQIDHAGHAIFQQRDAGGALAGAGLKQVAAGGHVQHMGNRDAHLAVCPRGRPPR